MATPDTVGRGDDRSRTTAGSFGAGRALLVFLAWVGGQIVGGFLGAVSGMFYLMSMGLELDDASKIEQHMVELLTPALAVGTITGAVAMIVAALTLARPHMREVSPTGVGWSRGPWRSLVLAAIVGLVVSSSFVLLVATIDPDLADTELGPIARLAEQDERVRWIWAIVAVMVAPVTEELLFRGVLFSGFAKSWGVGISATVVSVLFMLFHLAETLAYWPSIVAVGILTVGTIASRMMTNRLGPPIAMHLAYNTVLAIALIAGA
ncbi:MAG: CPBP family intramembrane metalloprotease [Acidobacteria bacterium]|nr:CPBP family intramembrane metalloprotease [Acidobacteriota bacterium]